MHLCSFDDIEDHVEIYAPNDNLTSNDNNIYNEPKENILTRVYEQDEPDEMVSDDDLDNFSLPEIMKLHVPDKPRRTNEHETYQQQLFDFNDDERVHARDEPSNEIEIITDDEIKPNTIVNQHRYNSHHQHYKLLTRNQRKNRKKRAKQYQYE
ncbi:unnamed protein product, partial [Rotaria sp. Silwood2]